MIRRTPPAREAEILYPVSEVAQLWRCSVDHIYDLIAAGRTRRDTDRHRQGQTRVSASSLEAFVLRNTTGQMTSRSDTDSPWITDLRRR